MRSKGTEEWKSQGIVKLECINALWTISVTALICSPALKHTHEKISKKKKKLKLKGFMDQSHHLLILNMRNGGRERVNDLSKVVTLFIPWPPDVESWLIWKDPDVGKDWRWEKKGMTENEMVGWHHWLDGHGFGWSPGVGDGQGGLVSRGPWGHK